MSTKKGNRKKNNFSQAVGYYNEAVNFKELGKELDSGIGQKSV